MKRTDLVLHMHALNELKAIVHCAKFCNALKYVFMLSDDGFIVFKTFCGN